MARLWSKEVADYDMAFWKWYQRYYKEAGKQKAEYANLDVNRFGKYIAFLSLKRYGEDEDVYKRQD